jgi:uncharacterized cupredoxin-like copper-binding protein
MSTTPRPLFAWLLGRAALLVTAGALALLGGLASARAASPVHRVTLDLEEFKLVPAQLHFTVGERVELRIKNVGTMGHEWQAGGGLVNTPGRQGFRTDLFALLKPRVSGQAFQVEKASTAGASVSELSEGENGQRLNDEVDIQPGGEVTLRFTVPASAKGHWEMGCLLPGHWEAGMHGTLVIG